MQVPSANETLRTTTETVAVYFKGELISYDYSENEKFSLAIFDNQLDSYKKNKPVFQTDLNFSKVEAPLGMGGAEDYTFLVDQPSNMSAGLYYYLIRLSDKACVGGSFVVEKQ